MSTTITATPTQQTPPPWPPRRSSRRGWLMAVGLAALVLIGLVGYARFGASDGSPIAPAQPPVDPQVAAIQQVIQRANTEQSQALSMLNPSVMSDTATAGYYQQLVQTNQTLLSQGVTSIELTNLTWGLISVSGANATATTAETWL